MLKRPRLRQTNQEDAMTQTTKKYTTEEFLSLYQRYARFSPGANSLTKYSIVTELLRSSWSRETCAPRSARHWSQNNRAAGQCDVSALIIDDLFGGTIMRAEIIGYGAHYYNHVSMGEGYYPLNVTRSQFPLNVTIPPGSPVTRDELLNSARASEALIKERYERLRSLCAAHMSFQLADCA
jgi:hypothetical protein